MTIQKFGHGLFGDTKFLRESPKKLLFGYGPGILVATHNLMTYLIFGPFEGSSIMLFKSTK